MTKDLQLLAQERGQLLERIAHQRGVLSLQVVPVQNVIGRGERAIASARSVGQYLSLHRGAVVLLAGVVSAVMVVLRPRRSLRLLQRGFVIWRSWRAMRAMGLFVPGSPLGTVVNTIRQRYL